MTEGCNFGAALPATDSLLVFQRNSFGLSGHWV